jgi:hypothetical protein
VPHFFLVEGGLGAGKTLTASVLAHHWRIKSGGEVRLFANYDLKGATPLDSVERWLEIADARGSICLWDEAQIQFDRRVWARNIFMSQIFNMTRKLRAVHIFINPVGENLDSRILQLVEVFIHVQKAQGRYIALDVYEYQDKRYGEWGRPLKRLIIPWHKVKQIFALELYDTDQMLYPFPSPKTEVQQREMLKRIIERQKEAAEREKHGIVGVEVNGWLNPSDYYADKERERDSTADAEGPEAVGVSLS